MGKGGIRYGRPRVPVEACHSLSAWGYFEFAQIGGEEDVGDSFEWRSEGEQAMIVFARDGQEYSQGIALTFTCCHFGGRRAWFVCPACGGRAGKVFLPCTMYSSGQRVTWFLCRLCHGLTYEQRQDRDKFWLWLHRAERIEAHWLGETSDGRVSKRKWQHWRTFSKWLERHQNLVEKADRAFLAGYRVS